MPQISSIKALNGIGLAKSVHVEGMVHSVYNNKIANRLNALPNNLTTVQAEDALKDLISDIRVWIQSHPNQNLNNIVL